MKKMQVAIVALIADWPRTRLRRHRVGGGAEGRPVRQGLVRSCGQVRKGRSQRTTKTTEGGPGRRDHRPCVASGKSAKPSAAATPHIGAASGAVIGSARSTTQMGMMYTVETAGGAIKVVTDQTEIHMGDCVMVEETSQGANIRRADPAVCNPAAADAGR